MFDNKRVVITGGSEGIGFACAEYFLKREAQVLITGRSRQKLAKASERLSSERLHTLVWDVTDFQNLNDRVTECAK